MFLKKRFRPGGKKFGLFCLFIFSLGNLFSPSTYLENLLLPSKINESQFSALNEEVLNASDDTSKPLQEVIPRKVNKYFSKKLKVIKEKEGKGKSDPGELGIAVRFQK